MKRIDSNSGMTLIETLVGVAVFSLIVMSTISFFGWTIAVYSRLQSMYAVANNIDVALTHMVYEIREAQSIYFPTSTSTQISLRTLHGAHANEGASFVDIYLCGSKVCIKREGGEEEFLTSDQVEVTDLGFTYISTSTAPSVFIDLSIRNANYTEGRKDNYSLDFHSAATLRSL